jgi:hypothetical protein
MAAVQQMSTCVCGARGKERRAIAPKVSEGFVYTQATRRVRSTSSVRFSRESSVVESGFVPIITWIDITIFSVSVRKCS